MSRQVLEVTLPADSITARYLETFERPVLPLPESPFAQIRYAGQYLSRPVFLEAEELSSLQRDLPLVHSALCSLPRRLFGGSLRDLARAIGMTEPHMACVLRGGSRADAVTAIARADLYKSATGFRLLEWNFGSTVGGAENVDMCRALLGVPDMASFLAKEGLGHADSDAAMSEVLRSETGFPVGTRPVVALVDTSGMFLRTEAILNALAARWADRGLVARTGHLGELARSDGRLELRGEPVDVVFRVFTIEDALAHLDDGLLEPLLSAVEDGDVAMFTRLDAELYGSKGALALLSDPAGQTGLTAEERGACARLLPWTRRVKAGETVLRDGTRGNLLAHIRENQQELVLKPCFSYGGNGVLVGADPAVSAERWQDALDRAVDGSYVVQELVRAEPELFPTAAPGEQAAWRLVWGVFTTPQGYAGTLVRGVPAEAEGAVVNAAQGAFFGSCFHSTADSDPA